MSFSIIAGVPKVDDKGRLRMVRFDDCPCSGEYVDAEKFMEKVERTGDSIYFHDYSSPEFWHRPTEFVYFAPDESTNSELFKEWAEWLRVHPTVWLQGYH